MQFPDRNVIPFTPKMAVDDLPVPLSHLTSAVHHFDELRRYTVQDGTAGGAPTEVVEYTLSWTENGVPHAGHHLHLLTVRDDRIVSDMVFCGGRWPAALLAEMEAAGA